MQACKISGLTEAFLVLKRAFKPQGTLYYELKVSHFSTAPWEKTLASIMGPRQKKILNEYVGLVRSFSRVHWFIVPILTLFTLHSDDFFPTLITKKAFTCCGLYTLRTKLNMAIHTLL